jgi:Tfp pilus assembly protein PilZ
MHAAPHLLLVANIQAESHHYTEKLKALGATCHVVKNLEDLGRTPPHSVFHGMLVDLNSFFRIPRKERTFFKEHALVLPTLKLILDQKNKTMEINQTSLDENHVPGINEFISKCAAAQPRAIRRSQRYKIFLNVKFDTHIANTADISRSGCFIFTTETSYKAGDNMFVYFMELSDQTPIPCKVMRSVNWGNKYLPAGIGVDFISMTELQRSELEAIFSVNVEKDEKMRHWTKNEHSS